METEGAKNITGISHKKQTFRYAVKQKTHAYLSNLFIQIVEKVKSHTSYYLTKNEKVYGMAVF